MASKFWEPMSQIERNRAWYHTLALCLVMRKQGYNRDGAVITEMMSVSYRELGPRPAEWPRVEWDIGDILEADTICDLHYIPKQED